MIARQKLTFGARTAIGTGTLAVVLVISVGFGLYTLSGLNDQFVNTAGSIARKLELAGILNAAEAEMSVGQRGVVLFTYAKDPARVATADQLFQDSSTKFKQAMDELRPLIITERGKQIARSMDSAMAIWLLAYGDLKRLAQSGDPDGAAKVLSDRITQHYLSIGKDAQELAQLANGLLQDSKQSAQARFSSSEWMVIFLLALGAAAAAGSLTIERSAARDLRRYASELSEGSRQVSAAAGQVASASQCLAQGTSEQAATLEETSSSTTEISAITAKNAENTASVAGLMNETAQLVEAANHNLEEMVQSMKEINGSSAKISKIIRVIDEIAFQTNILALNAAVEAARAGEAGMGFAVVADEVRNLAQRSAQAAKDTALLIEESIERSGEGSAKLDNVAQSIRQITGSATQIKTLVDEVNAGSQEQSRGIEQIAAALGQMDQVTQRSAASAEQSAAASEELAAQAQSLYDVVDRLRALADGGTDHSVASRAMHRAPAAAPARHSPGLAALRNSPHAEQPKAPSRVAARRSFPLDADEDAL